MICPCSSGPGIPSSRPTRIPMSLQRSTRSRNRTTTTGRSGDRGPARRDGAVAMQTWTGEAPRAALAETLKGFSAVYRSAGRRARITCILLGVVGFITLLAMIQDGSGALLVEDARAGMLLPKEANNFDRSTALVVFGSLGAQLLSAISYFAWVSRTVDNVPVLGGGRPSVTPRWSIGWWFVPIANLVKPFQIVRELHDRLAIG